MKHCHDANSRFHQGVGLAFLDLNAMTKCSCKDGFHGEGAVDPVVAIERVEYKYVWEILNSLYFKKSKLLSVSA